MSPQARAFLAMAALFACLLPAAAARAAPVIVVDGDRAERRDDPLVPDRASVRLAPPPGKATARAAGRVRVSASGARAVKRALGKALRAERITRGDYNRYRRDYRRARSVRRRLRGARGYQLGYVIASLDSIARRGRLGATRLPALFVQLRRNTRYWPRLPYPRAGDQITFRGSELIYEYYPGRGLQLQPLSTFKKANQMHGACLGTLDAPCRREGLRKLLDEMISMAVRRSRRFIAWEYMFDFGGGSPPWISGMAQATGIQALGRAAKLLREPRYNEVAARALGAFDARPPTGVRTRGFRGGTHYLQYSFAPRLYIFNAFLQSLIGLYDYARLSGDMSALDRYIRAEPEARREIPYSDVGDWSRYHYLGREANHDYHELMRELLQSMCNRRLGHLYCDYAERYRGYQVDPPELVYTGPDTATRNRYTRIRFSLSKLSAVEIHVYRAGKLAMYRLATFRRGGGSFLFRPRRTGVFTVRLAAKELRTGLGKKDRATGEFEVLAP
jgi:D-glucuronyl C5-epimerase C-terminus